MEKEVLFQSKTNKRFDKVIKFNGFKFRIVCTHTNGFVSGFNSKCCLYVMAEDGTWKPVIDNRVIGFRFDNYSIISNDSDPLIVGENKKAEDMFVDYIEKVYA